MLVLYAVPVSNYCATVRLLLRLKGVRFAEMAPPGGYGSIAYRGIVPTGTVPAIADGDLVLSESSVIAEYIEERFPGQALIPAGSAVSRARVRWLQRLHDTRVEPPLRALFAQVAPACRDRATLERGWADFHARLNELAQVADDGPYLVAAGRSLADYTYPATLLLAERMATAFEAALTLPGRLASWWTALRAEPVVAAELATYGEAVDAWIANKQGVA